MLWRLPNTHAINEILNQKHRNPVLLLFRDSKHREQNRSIVQHHHREHDRGRKTHQRYRYGKRNDVLHEEQHARTNGTSHARTSKAAATNHLFMLDDFFFGGAQGVFRHGKQKQLSYYSIFIVRAKILQKLKADRLQNFFEKS